VPEAGKPDDGEKLTRYTHVIQVEHCIEGAKERDKQATD